MFGKLELLEQVLLDQSGGGGGSSSDVGHGSMAQSWIWFTELCSSSCCFRAWHL